jgi:hypothetical protein
MGILKKKYKRDDSELIKSVIDSGLKTFITKIKMIETSKVKGYQIYECDYIDNGINRNINIIAVDISDAVTKLEGLVGKGIPEQTANYLLSSKTLNSK